MPELPLMGVGSWILMGLFAGVLARYLPGARTGCLATLAIGLAGALAGGFIATLLGFGGIRGFDVRSLIVATLGAVLLLLIAALLRPAPRGDRRRGR